MRSLQTYITILRKKGLLYSLHEGWKAVFPFHITHEKEEWDLIFQNNTYRYFVRHYSKYLRDYPMPSGNVPKKIWTFWLQGFENAPALVQQCKASVEKYASDYELHFLSEKDMLDYVHLPEHILKALKSGKLPYTQFSDILRTALLVENGGIWMDATVLLTAPLPDYITQQPLMLYRMPDGTRGKVLASNNFMAACAHHPIFENQLQLLSMYWKRELFLRDYLMYHLLFSTVITQNKQAHRLFEAMPFKLATDYHYTLYRLFLPYSEALWEELTNHSPFHKLSYKFTPEQLAQSQGTIYEHIMQL